MPSSISSALTRWLMAPCVTQSSSAARVKLSCRAAASNALSVSKGGKWRRIEDRPSLELLGQGREIMVCRQGAERATHHCRHRAEGGGWPAKFIHTCWSIARASTCITLAAHAPRSEDRLLLLVQTLSYGTRGVVNGKRCASSTTMSCPTSASRGRPPIGRHRSGFGRTNARQRELHCSEGKPWNTASLHSTSVPGP